VPPTPDVPSANPLCIDNFPLSAPTKSLLRSRGIEALFDIQAQCLAPVLGGKDMVGRARTGCGKTLAFVLPIIEMLAKDVGPSGRRPAGRPPSVIVLAPTRELAKQASVGLLLRRPFLPGRLCPEGPPRAAAGRSCALGCSSERGPAQPRAQQPRPPRCLCWRPGAPRAAPHASSAASWPPSPP
jgi:hypothetical protein